MATHSLPSSVPSGRTGWTTRHDLPAVGGMLLLGDDRPGDAWRETSGYLLDKLHDAGIDRRIARSETPGSHPCSSRRRRGPPAPQASADRRPRARCPWLSPGGDRLDDEQPASVQFLHFPGGPDDADHDAEFHRRLTAFEGAGAAPATACVSWTSSIIP